MLAHDAGQDHAGAKSVRAKTERWGRCVHSARKQAFPGTQKLARTTSPAVQGTQKGANGNRRGARTRGKSRDGGPLVRLSRGPLCVTSAGDGVPGRHPRTSLKGRGTSTRVNSEHMPGKLCRHRARSAAPFDVD